MRVQEQLTMQQLVQENQPSAISQALEDMHTQMPLLVESMEAVLPHPDLTRQQSGLSFLVCSSKLLPSPMVALTLNPKP